MLEHPWLTMPANYEYKYTDKQFDVLMFKKRMTEKNQKNEQLLLEESDDENKEMGVLIESEDDLGLADSEEDERDDSSREGGLSDRSRSFMDSDEGETLAQKKRKKEQEVKINNSFTGPYPLDPIDFAH